MSNEDLLRMLDLEGKEALQQNEALPITTTGEGTKSAPANPTALRLDDWGCVVVKMCYARASACKSA